MNILITSAGRRSYMIDYFKKALDGNGMVYASNSAMSPALVRADRYVISPLIYSDEYIPFLLSYCRKKQIGLLISLFDPDLPVLAAHKKEFEAIGVKLAVPDSDTCADCNDKYRMYLKLWKHRIRTPEVALSVEDAMLKIDSYQMNWPVIVKPRFGNGSVGLFKVYDKKELEAAYSMCKRQVENTYLKYESRDFLKECVLIQDFRQGDEYGLDIISDLDGNYRTTIVKKKLGMRSGETDEAVIPVKDSDEYRILKKLGDELAGCFNSVGIMDVDVIMDHDNNLPYVLDMNARFGGGYPFSHAAGADVVQAYILWAQSEPVPDLFFDVRECFRAYKDICIGTYDFTFSSDIF